MREVRQGLRGDQGDDRNLPGPSSWTTTHPQTPHTAATSKVSPLSLREKLLSDVRGPTPSTSKKENLIIPKDVLLDMFEATAKVCGKCMAKLELSIVNTSADTSLSVKCKGCEEEQYSSLPMSAEKPSLTENNTNLVGFAMREGLGHAGYSLLTSTISIKPLHLAAYYETRTWFWEHN